MSIPRVNVEHWENSLNVTIDTPIRDNGLFNVIIECVEGFLFIYFLQFSILKNLINFIFEKKKKKTDFLEQYYIYNMFHDCWLGQVVSDSITLSIPKPFLLLNESNFQAFSLRTQFLDSKSN